MSVISGIFKISLSLSRVYTLDTSNDRHFVVAYSMQGLF